jgi:hypothetical protein
MDATALICRGEERRKKLFNNPDWNGIDFLEVSDDQLSLCVHFFGHIPPNITVANVRIEGGRRIRDVHAVKVEIDSAHDPDLDDCLRITLDKFGDFSIYRFCLVEHVPVDEKAASANASHDGHRGSAWRPMSGLDPRYSCLEFTFKVDCPSDVDCKPTPCPPEFFPAPDINYLAKDYASFRQLILDRLALIMPDWQERHVPDLGITLVELIAYVGDYLSYYQDAVATEAYLDTARKRISVRRHAHLVGYRMHEGNNARAWVTVQTAGDLPKIMAKDIFFITSFAGIKASSGNVVRASDLEQVPAHMYEVYEPLVCESDLALEFRAAHSEIHFYTWGDRECCLPKGATRATLLDENPDPAKPAGDPPSPVPDAHRTAAPANVDEVPRELALKTGDVLIFEEVIGPTTGNPSDADPARRHAVRLTKVCPNVDGLLNRRVLDIEWAPEDALPFSLCLSARMPAPDCSWKYGMSVARGNVLLVDHGRSVSEPLGPVTTKQTIEECACEGSVIESTTVPDRFEPALMYAPLTFGEPLRPATPASRSVLQDARQAVPLVSLQELAGDARTAPGDPWSVRFDLFTSGGDDHNFVAEIDEDGRAHLRFGDGDLGHQPAAATRFKATYRIGVGPAGNVGRETITYMVLRSGILSADAILPRNPLPAQGGQAAEPVALVKLLAPSAFRTQRERAIIPADYAELAQRNHAIQRAAAEFRWMGSWYESRVAIDPAHTDVAEPALLKTINRDLFRYRRMGHDLAVAPARYIAVDLAIEVCVLPHYTRGHVKAALLEVFSNRQRADGKPGFFHPDRLTFGDGIYLSQIVAAAKSVDGLETIKVIRLKRLNEADSGALDSGVLSFGAFEVAECGNDSNFPEAGKLEFIMRGGR